MNDGRGRSTLRQWLIAFGTVVVAGGLALVFFGAGADLSRQQIVTIVVRQTDVQPEVARSITVGDTIYNDIAGVEIGRVVDVKVIPQPRTVSDAKGVIHKVEDPLSDQVEITIRGKGRVGDGYTMLYSQVIENGRQILVVSKKYYLLPTVVSVDVR